MILLQRKTRESRRAVVEKVSKEEKKEAPQGLKGEYSFQLPNSLLQPDVYVTARCSLWEATD